jgi:esterase/lipase
MYKMICAAYIFVKFSPSFSKLLQVFFLYKVVNFRRGLLKAFQDESVKAARERMAETRGRLEFATGAEKKDVAADARRAVDEVRNALMTAICTNDPSIKMMSLEKVMDAMDTQRTKATDGPKKKKAAEKAPVAEDAAKKKTT